jgi:small subunit ribosomal protein S20
MKTHIKRVLKAVEAGDAAAAHAELPKAMKKIDKAAKRNVIHGNQASRRIARLSRKVSALEQKAGAEDPSES